MVAGRGSPWCQAARPGRLSAWSRGFVSPVTWARTGPPTPSSCWPSTTADLVSFSMQCCCRRRMTSGSRRTCCRSGIVSSCAADESTVALCSCTSWRPAPVMPPAARGMWSPAGGVRTLTAHCRRLTRAYRERVLPGPRSTGAHGCCTHGAWSKKAASEPSLTLMAGPGTASGASGCNRYSLAVEDGASPGEVSFGPAAGTRKACPDPLMDIEKRYLRPAGTG